MAPQSDPEAIQMDMGRPFETYGIYCLGTKVGHKEWHRKLNFSLLAVLSVFFTGSAPLFSISVPKGCPKWTRLSWAWHPENQQNSQAPPSATKSCQLSSNWLLFWLPRHPNDTKSGLHSFQKTAARTSLRAAPAQPQDNSYQKIGESCACTASGKRLPKN